MGKFGFLVIKSLEKGMEAGTGFQCLSLSFSFLACPFLLLSLKLYPPFLADITQRCTKVPELETLAVVLHSIPGNEWMRKLGKCFAKICTIGSPAPCVASNMLYVCMCLSTFMRASYETEWEKNMSTLFFQKDKLRRKHRLWKKKKLFCLCYTSKVAWKVIFVPCTTDAPSRENGVTFGSRFLFPIFPAPHIKQKLFFRQLLFYLRP